MILKQQKLIKRLLRRRGSSNDFLEGNSNIVKASSGEAKVVADKNRPDYEALNDSSDSAIISDCCQVVESLPVPTLPRRSQKEVPSVPPAAPEIVETKTAETDKNRKEERQRISNRQKLLLLKRHHSGFLKRPEILETVYSVEEDGGELQLTENKPQTQQQTPLHQPRRLSSSSAPLRRTRLDSDFNSDYSTDDESTRLMFSETETACSCSQSCSRRSSWGKCCLVTASAPASRRSSCGSMFNRVMSNHRHVVTPQDVKYKRINKVKSKSLEELRGKLKESTRSSSTNDEDIEDLEEDFSGPRPSRLHLLRQQQRSFSLDQESTDASTN